MAVVNLGAVLYILSITSFDYGGLSLLHSPNGSSFTYTHRFQKLFTITCFASALLIFDVITGMRLLLFISMLNLCQMSLMPCTISVHTVSLFYTLGFDLPI